MGRGSVIELVLVTRGSGGRGSIVRRGVPAIEVNSGTTGTSAAGRTSDAFTRTDRKGRVVERAVVV